MQNRHIAYLVLCATLFTLTGCIGHTAQGIGRGHAIISDAKVRDHSQIHESSEDTVIREKKEEYLDQYASCLEQHGGRVEPCKGYKEIVDHYNRVTADRRTASTGMDPVVEAVIYENLAIGRWEDWGQNSQINRNTREIDANTARDRRLQEAFELQVRLVWESLDEIEQDSQELNHLYDEVQTANIEELMDELDGLRYMIDSIPVDANQTAQMLERISQLESELKTLKGVK